MNLNRLTITQACFVSLLTVAPAGPAMAAQLHLGSLQRSSEASAESRSVTRHEDAAVLQSARSILEPIELKGAKPVVPSSNAALAETNPVSKDHSNPVEKAQACGQNMFDRLDAIVAATVQADAESESPASENLKTAGYDSDSFGLSVDRVGQASAELPALIAPGGLQPTLVGAALASEEAIMIHPPTTKPTAPNRHYFQIENTSARTATNVVVELEVPSNVCIIEVVPCHTIVVNKTARYKFPSIAAGEKKTIELTTTPNLIEEVVFESRFSMEHVQRLAAKSAPHKVEVWSPEKTATEGPAIAAAAKLSENGKVVATKVGANSEPEMKVRSARVDRTRLKKEARLSYGPVGVPGKVMVANPEANAVDSQLTEEPVERVADATSSALGNSDSVEPMVTSQRLDPVAASEPTAAVQVGAFQSQLKTKIDGPQHAVTGEEAEYRVLVENTSAEDVDEVLVQLAIPAGLEVTVLDRNAWFDGAARTITWKLPSVNAGDSETIRYLAKVVSPDGQLQKVTLGTANQFRGQAIFQSTVMEQYELAAPLLPFEKDAKSLK